MTCLDSVPSTIQAPAPDPTRIPADDLLGTTVLMVTCSYRTHEFIRVGYYVNNAYSEPLGEGEIANERQPMNRGPKSTHSLLHVTHNSPDFPRRRGAPEAMPAEQGDSKHPRRKAAGDEVADRVGPGRVSLRARIFSFFLLGATDVQVNRTGLRRSPRGQSRKVNLMGRSRRVKYKGRSRGGHGPSYARVTHTWKKEARDCPITRADDKRSCSAEDKRSCMRTQVGCCGI